MKSNNPLQSGQSMPSCLLLLQKPRQHTLAPEQAGSLDFTSTTSRQNMNKKASDRRKQRLQEKQLDLVFFFISVAVLSHWLSFRIFTATDCELFGSKLAPVTIPTCVTFANQGVVLSSYLIASVSFFMVFLSLRQYRNLTYP